LRRPGLGILPGLLDEFLGLRARGAVRFAADDAVNALAIDHDVDREHPVAVSLPLEGDAMLVEFVAGSQLAHIRASEFGKSLGHD
jgi:hypothetical protein